MKEKHSCAICGRRLQGISNKGPKTKKRVSRPFPNLCVSCYERVFRMAKRINREEITEQDVDLRYIQYVKTLRGKF